MTYDPLDRRVLRVLTVGTFDLFHSGHARLLKRCAKLGEVVVGLNTDEFIEKYKGSPPVVPFKDREEVLRACRYVSDVVMNNQGNGSMLTLLQSVRPDILAVGSDWAKKNYYKQIGVSERVLEELGITLVYLPYTEGISTTELKKRLK